MHYGEDVPSRPRRVERVEDLHAQEVMLRAALIEEFRAVFNIACLFADALKKVSPTHSLLCIAESEGMLGRFELKEKNVQQEEVRSESRIQEVAERVQQEVETGEVHERPGVPEEVPRQCESVPQADGADSPTG